MDDYKKIPFDDPDLCVPDLDDFDQMKEFFLDCAAEYFRYLSSDDMEKMLAALGKRIDVLATPTDDVFISVSPDAVLDMYDPDGVPVIAYFFPNGYGTKTNDNGCSNVIASLYGRDNFTSYLARAANEEKILYIDSEKYEQMEKELPRYGGTRFPPALAALSMDIIIPSSYICKMKAEINPKLSDREREHNSLNRTMHIKVADSRRNRLAQDRDKPRNITLRYDDDNRDSQ